MSSAVHVLFAMISSSLYLVAFILCLRIELFVTLGTFYGTQLFRKMKRGSSTLFQERKHHPQRKNCCCIQEQQAPGAHQHSTLLVKTKHPFPFERKISFISLEISRVQSVHTEGPLLVIMQSVPSSSCIKVLFMRQE